MTNQRAAITALVEGGHQIVGYGDVSVAAGHTSTVCKTPSFMEGGLLTVSRAIYDGQKVGWLVKRGANRGVWIPFAESRDDPHWAAAEAFHVLLRAAEEGASYYRNAKNLAGKLADEVTSRHAAEGRALEMEIRLYLAQGATISRVPVPDKGPKGGHSYTYWTTYFRLQACLPGGEILKDWGELSVGHGTDGYRSEMVRDVERILAKIQTEQTEAA